MLNVTLTAQEWIKLRDAALQAYPNELVLRGEMTRRFALAGIEGDQAADGRGREAAGAPASFLAARGRSGG